MVIPCFNHEQFIQQAIESILEQTYNNIELLIINDGSKDNSILKIREMAPKCLSRLTRFEFIDRDNKGLSETLNEGLNWAKGKYFSPLASDDYYHRDKVFEQVKLLEKQENNKYCVTKAYVVSDTNRILEVDTELYNKGLDGEISFSDIFLFKTHLPVTGLYETDFLKNILGGFDSKLSAEDYDLNLRIAQINEIEVVPKYLYYYRSPKAIGRKTKRMAMRVDVSESHYQTILKYKEHPNFKEAVLEWNFRRLIYFSRYKSTKIYALQGLMNCLKKYDSLLFYKAIFRLIFFWD